MSQRHQWIWMPHAGHFILGDKCRFKLNTCVGNYIVSTVGELVRPPNTKEIIKADANGFEDIGWNRTYETMVFPAMKVTEHLCCPYRVSDYVELEMVGYRDAESAYKGHLKLCHKWASKPPYNQKKEKK